MEDKLQHTSTPPRDFSFHLLERITNKFSRDNIIGYGGYGTVYKGVLDNGEIIAVKKLHPKYPELDDDKQFKNECINLMRVQHKNVVRLVGYCYEIAHKVMEYNGQHVFARVEERALCFEYLQGGSLDKHLSEEYSGLGWPTRYKIIRGICEGLHHLHKGCMEPIYHLDLKPANILLDQDMMPKIGDFGLSRIVDSTKTCTTKEIRGTHGYMPPEYIDRNQITPKFDVFSLGIIIIQIMVGRDGYSRCGDMPSQEFINLVHDNWLKTWPSTMASHTAHEVKKCIEIALRCVEADRVKRPTITEIVDELNKFDTGNRSLINQSRGEGRGGVSQKPLGGGRSNSGSGPARKLRTARAAALPQLQPATIFKSPSFIQEEIEVAEELFALTWQFPKRMRTRSQGTRQSAMGEGQGGVSQKPLGGGGSNSGSGPVRKLRPARPAALPQRQPAKLVRQPSLSANQQSFARIQEEIEVAEVLFALTRHFPPKRI